MNKFEKTVEEIRRFNRFYTVNMGLLTSGYLDSDFSVIETRILYELWSNASMTQSEISQLLNIDKSYLSRIIKRFEKNGLIIRTESADDRRVHFIALTDKGKALSNLQIKRTNEQIKKQIKELSADECIELCDALQAVIRILGK